MPTVRAIDMRADMTRSTEGGSETPCTGYEPYVAPISIKRLFRPGRRTLRLRDSHTFTSGQAEPSSVALPPRPGPSR